MKRGDLSDSASVTGLPIFHDWRVRMKRGDLSDSVSVTGDQSPTTGVSQ